MRNFLLYPGQPICAVQIQERRQTVIINQNDYYISNSGLLDCEMLDLTTGQLVEGDYSKLSKCYYKISNFWMADWLM